MSIRRFARVSNIILGLWLFVSAFAWPHTAAERTNVALVGLFIALTSLTAWTTGPGLRLRLINAILGAWLLVSIVAFPTSSKATTVNSAIVGVLVFVLSLLPSFAYRGEAEPVTRC
jgi:hypothetical protein